MKIINLCQYQFESLKVKISKMRPWILVIIVAFIAYLFFIKLNRWKPGVGMKFRKNNSPNIS
ncbi:hypothetical protein DERP_011436 [Dermatophagoides pteronyssinus]|uniref:Uncharacterized protein n=1 Tax=Dermatophagoides pteronyssinus TaxID=6956 RepID=A0ABQ8J5A7_DERPT|nr:hypothetical protein DERP_011436 [Dermatophagoides pteronyssinus]